MIGFAKDVLARRKIILIYILAIFLPSLIIGYLSLSTFAKRREAVKKLLESNLWISGDSALKSLEEKLIENEKDALRQDNFIDFIRRKKDDQALPFSSRISKDKLGRFFLLDSDFQILFPETGKERPLVAISEKNISDDAFSRLYKEAEVFEFSQKNYARAADLYQKCVMIAAQKPYQALALEGLGRCFFRLNKYDEANGIYRRLASQHGQSLTKAGHPVGIAAALQLSEICLGQDKEEEALKILIELCERIRNGEWPLQVSAYEFFIDEIESRLDHIFRDMRFPDLRISYNALRIQESPYGQILVYSEFLERNVIPVLKERFSLPLSGKEANPQRFQVSQGEKKLLASCAVFRNIQDGRSYLGGFFWDLDDLHKEVFPAVLLPLSKESGLHFQVVDNSGQYSLATNKEFSSKGSLSLPFRQFPMPWKLVVSQPTFKDLERTARRENLFFGILLAFVVALMLMGALLMARDISRESESTRLKTEFVHNISHELKTPLALIRLYGETLQIKKNLTEDQRKECYEIITKESERLSHLINNVLDFSRIEMGRKEFDFKKGDLARVVRDTLESYRYHLEKKGFSIQNEIASDLPEMSFDGEAIASVVINLVSNAMKFSPDRKEVTVRLFKEGDDAVLQVVDKGIGISPEERSKIFERFYRSKNKTVSEARGSGLGLTLVKHIAEAHGGRINVESEPGNGSTFSVVLPLVKRE